jgi:hypothetical protein
MARRAPPLGGHINWGILWTTDSTDVNYYCTSGMC